MESGLLWFGMVQSQQQCRKIYSVHLQMQESYLYAHINDGSSVFASTFIPPYRRVEEFNIKGLTQGFDTYSLAMP